MLRYIAVSFILVFIFSISGFTQENNSEQPKIALSDLSIDMQWFLSYLNGKENGTTFNQFTLKRGYVNIKKKINNQLSGRITIDITRDLEGDGEGDVEMRLKYLYLKYSLPSISFFYKPFLEFGLVHRPWIDFEQHINDYRVQGTMFLERNDVINSGDFGVVFMSYLGGEMDKEYQENISDSFAGKYGSFALSISNGGGYHALEKNENKSLEGRFSLRPFPHVIPGLQFTLHGAVGKGNIPESPDWNYNSGYISYESKKLILTGEFYSGLGNYKGSSIRDTVSFKSNPQQGYSFFGEYKIFHSMFSLFGRYDHFAEDLGSQDFITKRSIVGFVFHFKHSSKVLIDYDKVSYTGKNKAGSEIFEVAIELRY
jgi:hypothetical protein